MRTQTLPDPVTSAPAATQPRARSWSLPLGITALLGATLVSLVIGAAIVPMEAAHGRLFTDTPAGYQLLVYALGATMILWTVLGLAALITGVLSLMRHGANGRAIGGIALAVLSPFAAVAALIGAMLGGAMLL